MIPFVEQARFYATFHKSETTQYAHMAGVPMIVLALMILLGFVHITIIGVLDLSLANIATLALLIYYYRLQWRLSLVLTPIIILLLWIADIISHNGPTVSALWMFLIIFISGVVLQSIEYILEKKQPNYIDNLWRLLLSPLLITAELIFMLGKMNALKEDIHGKEK